MENPDHAPPPVLPTAADGKVSAIPRLHLDFLDGLRAVLALIVTLDHAYVNVWAPAEFDSPQNPFYLLRYLYAMGSLCVGSFLVVSGFCLMLPIVRKNGALTGGATLFYKRRLRRIVPPYYFAMLLALLPWIVKHRVVKLTYADMLSHLALVHNLFPATIYSINGAFWSIAVESQIYLLFPLIIASWNRMGKAITLIILACVGIMGWHARNITLCAGLSLYLYPMFGMGMAGAWIAFDPSREMQWLRERFPWKWVCLAAIGTLFLLFQVLGLEKALTQLVYGYWLVGIAVAAVLILGSQAQLPRGLRWLAWKPLVWIGTFSYSLYLIHLPLLTWFTNFVGHLYAGPKALVFLLLTFIAMPLIVGFAFVFFWFCERPFLPGSRKTKRQREAATALSPAP